MTSLRFRTEVVASKFPTRSMSLFLLGGVPFDPHRPLSYSESFSELITNINTSYYFIALLMSGSGFVTPTPFPLRN